MTNKPTSFQGHRGARGLLPENTIPAFIRSLEYGITIMELDVVVSADSQLVVSHEAWFNPAICSQPNGDSIPEKEGKTFNIYQMNYNDIQLYDCGSKGNPKFPEQQPMPAFKPLLQYVITACDSFAQEHNLPLPYYDIELKTEGPEGDGIFHPKPNEFARFALQVIKEYNITNRVVIQSFDKRILRAMRQLDDSIALSMLIDNLNGVQWNLTKLGFTPNMYAPHYQMVTPKLVKEVHNNDMELVVWTVNDIKDMRYLMQIGVNSIITDYPDRARQLLDQLSGE